MTTLPSTTEEPQKEKKTVNSKQDPKPAKGGKKKKTVKKKTPESPEITEAQQKLQADAKRRVSELMSRIEEWRDPNVQEASNPITVNLSACITSQGYQKKIPHDVVLRSLSKKQKFGLRVLQTGMIFNESELANGQRVNNGPNALKMILELIADLAREVFVEE